MSDLSTKIEEIWSTRDSLDADDEGANSAIHAAIDLLDTGEARVAEPATDGGMVVNEWLKQETLQDLPTDRNLKQRFLRS